VAQFGNKDEIMQAALRNGEAAAGPAPVPALRAVSARPADPAASSGPVQES
jgi:hypothetical protein